VTLVISQRSEVPDAQTLREDLIAQVIEPVFAGESVRPDAHTQIFVNPDGPKIGGGPALHSGMTGRKTAVDTYGGYARHSGSALSGKDPLRIDRIAAYAARYAAKNVVAAGLAEECEVQLSYSIGLARPVGMQVETFGTGRQEDAAIARKLQKCFDFRPGGILRAFALSQAAASHQGKFFQRLAAYGQVGRADMDLPWERTDLAEVLV
jgi:S-adenosylmethionine synthetase